MTIDFLKILTDLLSLVPPVTTIAGLSAAVALIVALVKLIPGFPDGWGGVLALALNAVAYILLGFFEPGEIEPFVNIIVAVLTVVVGYFGSVAVHKGGVSKGVWPFKSLSSK